MNHLLLFSPAHYYAFFTFSSSRKVESELWRMDPGGEDNRKGFGAEGVRKRGKKV